MFFNQVIDIGVCVCNFFRREALALWTRVIYPLHGSDRISSDFQNSPSYILLIRDEIKHHIRDLLCCHPPVEIFIDPSQLILRPQRRLHTPWSNGVHANIEFGLEICERACEAGYGVLAGYIHRSGQEGRLRSSGGDNYNYPMAQLLALERVDSQLGGTNWVVDVDIESLER